jgi:hypothetical protein
MQKEITVCDVCQDLTLPVTTYTVSAAGRTATTDLCANHSADLEAILATGKLEAILATGKLEPARQPGRRLEVMSVEEVARARRQTTGKLEPARRPGRPGLEVTSMEEVARARRQK